MKKRCFRSTWLSWRPRVCLFHGLLTPDECAALIRVAGARLGGCEVNAPSKRDRRSSEACWIPRSDLREVWQNERHRRLVARVEERVAHATGFPIYHGEPPQMLRYSCGAEYTCHPDFFDPEDRRALANGGQRCATVLIYLNNVASDAGGATYFPEARLRVQPAVGDALLFFNTHPDGSIDPSSVHAGEPVLRPDAVKWVLSKWLRARRFEVDCRGFRAQRW